MSYSSMPKFLTVTATTLVVLAGMMVAALWNGYPIVYSDTASYIISGFDLDTLADRPVTYGWFIRICSLNGWSLWCVVIAQSLLLGHMIGLTLKSVGVQNAWTRASIILITSILTGLPFVSGQIMTDVFSPILFLSLYLILFTQQPGAERKRTFAIFLLAFAMHMSHIAITLIILVGVIMLKFSRSHKWKGAPTWRTLVTVAVLSAIGYVPMGVCVSKSGSSFFAARMADSGILQAYLNEHCADRPFKLCAEKDKIARDANALLWSENTPLHVFHDRREMNAELTIIRNGSLTEPRFIVMHIKAALSATIHQLVHFDVGDGNGPFDRTTRLNERIRTYFPSEAEQFEHAHQMFPDGFTKVLRGCNVLYSSTCGLSLLIVMVMLIFRNRLLRSRRDLVVLSLFLIMAVIINALVNSSLVMVADRFGTKLTWILTFDAVLLCFASMRNVPLPEDGAVS